jgi:DNA polymerase III subunit gamma/tau
MYHALYRKYRPSNFDDVVGQDVIVTTLKNSIINKTFTHAYMFFGPRGTGKTTISKIFARAVNCSNPTEAGPCNECDNCIHSMEKECVDIIEIDAASNNGVDEIRELKSKISLVPAELKYKVYIIDEVHMLSIGAFNALLKTLEEPPEHAIFILATTDPQKVPETIISRCQCFSFKRISESSIVNRLKSIVEKENISIDSKVLNEISSFCDGGMRDALGLLDKLSSYTDKKITEESFAELNGIITKDELEKFSKCIFEADIPNVLSSLDNYNDSGKNLVQVIVQLMNYLRNIVVDYYVNNTKCDYSVDVVLSLVNEINNNLFEIKRADNPRIYIEMFLVDFCSNKISAGETKIISREIILPESNVKTESNKNVENKDTAEKKQTNVRNNETNIVSTDFAVKSLVPLNIDDIMKARVNNIMAQANKNILKSIIDNMNIFNDYTFDTEIGFAACALLDANVRAASPDGFILSYEYDSIVKQNISNIKKITEIYNKICNTNYAIAIISDSDWETEKKNYISVIKSGGSYKIIEEPKEELLDESEKSDIISNDAINLFGDIVEID